VSPVLGLPEHAVQEHDGRPGAAVQARELVIGYRWIH